MPTWSIVYSRRWKAQIPFLARHWQVVTFDGRGNGRSDRPADVAAYADTEFVADALAVMDAARVERRVVVGLSRARAGARLAASIPIACRSRRLRGRRCRSPIRFPGNVPFEGAREAYEGWAGEHDYWRTDYRDFGVLLRRCLMSPTRPSRSRTASAGRSRPTPRP